MNLQQQKIARKIKNALIVDIKTTIDCDFLGSIQIEPKKNAYVVRYIDPDNHRKIKYITKSIEALTAYVVGLYDALMTIKSWHDNKTI